MNILINVAAWTSFLVSGFYLAIAFIIVVLAIFAKAKFTLTIQPSFFFFLVGFIWPIVYFFAS